MWDDETAPGFCATIDCTNAPIGESITGVVDVAVDDDGFCEVVDLLCADCLQEAS